MGEGTEVGRSCGQTSTGSTGGLHPPDSLTLAHGATFSGPFSCPILPLVRMNLCLALALAGDVYLAGRTGERVQAPAPLEQSRERRGLVMGDGAPCQTWLTAAVQGGRGQAVQPLVQRNPGVPSLILACSSGLPGQPACAPGPECTSCKRAFSPYFKKEPMYQLPCGHLLCRPCLGEKQCSQPTTCTACQQPFASQDVLRVHF